MTSSPVPAEKRCSTCGATKPLSEFHRRNASPDGHHSECKPCANARTKASIARRRAEMGEEAWAEHHRQASARSRARTENKAGRAYNAARSAAISALIARHRAEYDQLLTLARRGELPRPEAKP